MKAVIMAGGAGTRFWPMSTEERPKQFLKLTSGKTMIQETYGRFRLWLPADRIYVVTTEQFLPLIREQLPELRPDQVIIEPCRRDTGPCVALTALHFLRLGDDEVLVTAPSDQYIPNGDMLENVLKKAEAAASENGVITTLGIVPSRPETGYGYIETEEGTSGDGIFRVKTFLEKPTLEKAIALIQKSNMFWNSGIFIWKASTIAHYMSLHQPDMWNQLLDCQGQWAAVYPKLPKISVDYAILEKADRVMMIPFPAVWDDVGSWTSLERIYTVNEEGNILIGDIHLLGVENSIIWSDKHNTVVIGVKDLIVVSTEKGLLVCHKSQEQNIKKIIQSLG